MPQGPRPIWEQYPRHRGTERHEAATTNQLREAPGVRVTRAPASTSLLDGAALAASGSSRGWTVLRTRHSVRDAGARDRVGPGAGRGLQLTSASTSWNTTTSSTSRRVRRRGAPQSVEPARSARRPDDDARGREQRARWSGQGGGGRADGCWRSYADLCPFLAV